MTDSLFIQPDRAGVLLAIYNNFHPVADLTSIDLAPPTTTGPPFGFSTQTADALPNVGYVFQVPGPGSSVLYGAIRPTHVGTTFIILGWSLQTEPEQPRAENGLHRQEGIVVGVASRRRDGRRELVKSWGSVEIRPHVRPDAGARRPLAHHRGRGAGCAQPAGDRCR